MSLGCELYCTPDLHHILPMKQSLLAISAILVAAAPVQAQRAIAYEGGVFGHFTKFEKITTLDNGFGGGIHVDAYLLRRLALEYSGDASSNTSARTATDLTIVNHRFDLVYNQPLTDKWRALIGGGWTGTRFNGDTTKNEYDSGLNALLGLRYCVNDNWSWKAEGLVDFKDPADQAPSFSRTKAYSLRLGLTRFFGGQAKNGPCIASMKAEPMPAPPPAAITPAPQQQQPAAPPQQQQQAAPPPQPQQAAPAPAPRPAMRFGPVHFEFDKAALTQADRDTLAVAVKFLTDNPTARIDVIGHTDNVGTEEYNIRLGSRRAMAVRAYLVNAGVAEGRITTSTRGEAEPIADNTTAEGRAMNRRAVIVEVRP